MAGVRAYAATAAALLFRRERRSRWGRGAGSRWRTRCLRTTHCRCWGADPNAGVASASVSARQPDPRRSFRWGLKYAGLGRSVRDLPGGDSVRAVTAALGARPRHGVPWGAANGHVVDVGTAGVCLGQNQVTVQASAGDVRGQLDARVRRSRLRDAAWIVAQSMLGLLVSAVGVNGADADPDFRKKVMSALPRRTRKDLERVAQEEGIDVRGDYSHLGGRGAWEGVAGGNRLVTRPACGRKELAPKAMAASASRGTTRAACNP